MTHRTRTVVVVGAFVLVGVIARYWADVTTQLGHWYYGMKADHSQERVLGANISSRVEWLSFHSNVINENRSLRIYIPSGYDSNQAKKYPALYLLHGFPGNNEDWLINAGLQHQLDDLIGAGKLPPVIVVFPDGNGPTIQDSQYLNATAVSQPMEDYILEIVKITDDRFRTLPDRLHRAIGGLSSGAYGAMNIGLRHNDIFSCVISHSGYFKNRESVFAKLMGKDTKARLANEPLEYIQNMAINPVTSIYMDIGVDDSAAFIQSNIDFDTALKDKHVPHTFTKTSGGHTWGTWTKNIQLSLLYWSVYLRNHST